MSRPVDLHLNELRQLMLRMGSLSEEILRRALDALWNRDLALAQRVKQDDVAIDEIDVKVDALAMHILATQAPVADDLREVLAAKMIAVDLERVGDIARNIAKSAQRLAGRARANSPRQLSALAEDAQRILRRALDAFNERDSERAAEVLAGDDAIDDHENHVIRAALEEIHRNPEFGSQEVDFILIAKNLERVADHATNIAENVIFANDAKNVKHAKKLEG